MKRPTRGTTQPKQSFTRYKGDRYLTTAWRKLSKQFRDENPLCVKCKEKGKLTPAHCVDHKLPIEQGGEMYDWTNLQSLCESCHNAKSAGERLNKSG